MIDLKKDFLLKQFSHIYFNSLPPRALQEKNAEELQAFIKERYIFFLEAFPKGGAFRIISEPEKDSWKTKHIFEFVYPDAMFIVLTFQSLFREYGLRMNHLLHPIIGIEQDDTGAILSLKEPQTKQTRVSVTYIEFDEIEDPKVLVEFERRVHQHMTAVQCSYRDQELIIHQIHHIGEAMNSHPGDVIESVREWQNVLKWLLDDNFSFFGYILFRYPHHSPEISKESGLGILSSDYLKWDNAGLLSAIIEASRRSQSNTAPFLFDTIQIKSPIQRFENLMRLSLKILTPEGQIEEHVFIGLLRRSSLLTKNMDTPLIHLKMKIIFKQRQMVEGSHDYNEVIRIFTNIPKFELFRTSSQSLLRMVDDLLSITNPHDIYCFTRNRDESTVLPLMVVIPPTLFSRTNIQQTVDYLKTQVPHSFFELIEVRGDDYCRLHFYFEQPRDTAFQPDCERYEAEISERIRPWIDRLKNILMEVYPGKQGKDLFTKYANAFPNHYQVRRSPQETLKDIRYLERLSQEKSVQFSIVPFEFPGSLVSGKVSLLSVYSADKIDLIQIMPILQYVGLHVYDELTTRVGTTEIQYAYIHCFRVADEKGSRVDDEGVSSLLVALLKEVFMGHTENDPLNALVLKIKMDWRAINVLQTYRNLLLQLSSAFTKEKLNETFLTYPNTSRLLFNYFWNKFSPNKALTEETRKKTVLPELKQTFLESLRDVHLVIEDTLFRHIFTLMEHTVRTNFFIPKRSGSETFISIKLISKRVPFIPAPAPRFEIYTHDVHMEGLHLRFGPIARGGIRWSDRPDDFRKEILGLVKTQQTKNVVIVPVGAKGGFVIKHHPFQKAPEVQEEYKKFVSALLDVTDTYNAKNEIITPKHVLSYDAADPYLVVAADKGTAHFSDVANEISENYGFWLGDAFASGGSVGYNHKKEGITARGVWECVKIHFKEIGKNSDEEVISVIGVGDMSGDVFGNGMLLSKKFKLVAAFNHAHIFLDPDPDPLKSWKERYRLFHLPRSTWKEYASECISSGGGVFDRKAKEITLSPQIQTVLGSSQEKMTGEELIHSILKMKVDLLWLGGIGTYIKSSIETNLKVGDPANDAVRINSTECKASVIGEGANLGVSQLGRIELNKRGIHINTDAIDNSAGVNMSDYEVNIKILLKQALNKRLLSGIKERNQILTEITNDVAEKCLNNNRSQHRLLSLDTLRSQKLFTVFARYIAYLIEHDKLHPERDAIPVQKELEEFGEQGKPFPRPVLAVLQAASKQILHKEIVASELTKDPHFDYLYLNYFPSSLLSHFQGSVFPNHPLREAIIAMVITNKVINQAGLHFVYWAKKQTGKAAPDIVRYYLFFDHCLEGDAFREKIYACPVREEDKYQAVLEYENLLYKLTIDFLMLSDLSSLKTDAFHQTVKQKITLLKKKNLRSAEFKEEIRRWKQGGFPKETAEMMALTRSLNFLVDLVYLHQKYVLPLTTAYELLVTIEQKFAFDWLRNKIKKINLQTAWEFEHGEILTQTLRFQKLQFIEKMLRSKKGYKTMNVDIAITEFMEKNQWIVDQYFFHLKQLKSGSPVTLTTLTVTIDRLNFLN